MRSLLNMRLQLAAKGFLVAIAMCLGVNLGLLLLVRSAFDDALVASARRAEALALVGDLQAQTSLMRIAVDRFSRTQDPRIPHVYSEMQAARDGRKAPPDVDSPAVYWARALSDPEATPPARRAAAASWQQRAGELLVEGPERAALQKVGEALESLRQIERVTAASVTTAHSVAGGLFADSTFATDSPSAQRAKSAAYAARNDQLLASLDELQQTVRVSSALRAERAQTHVTCALGTAVVIDLILIPLLGLSMWVSRSTLFRPLAKLEEAARRLSRGQYAAWVRRPELLLHAELRTLGIALNDMGLAVARDLEQRELIARELRQARDEAEDAARSKSMFLANMGHEIRTPLNAVLGMTHLALQTDLTAQQRDYLQKSLGAGKSLMGVLNDVLDFSKIEAGKLELESVEFDLPDLVDESLLLVRQRAREKGLELTCEFAQAPPLSEVGCLRADRLRIGQVLTNLLSNAVKFTDKGHVLLKVKVALGLGMGRGTLCIEVSDTGIGMSRDQIDRLFAEFTQADGSTTRRFGGTGLGLSIVKRLTSLMGGQVVADSAPGVGSSFALTIPVEIARAAPAAFADLSATRVLVVDTCARTRSALVSTLGALEVGRIGGLREASDAQEALSQAADSVRDSRPFDLVVVSLETQAEEGSALLASLHRELPQAEALLLCRDDEGGLAQCPAGLHFLVLAQPVTPAALRGALARLAAPAVEPAPSALEPEADLQGLRVFLVEDNPLNQEIASALLTRAGAQVELADNGLQALSRLRAVGPFAFDAVLMDLQMPVMDGHEAVRHLRQIKGFELLPVIALTAHAFQQEKDRCLALGMSGHLVKPLVPADLYKALQPLAKKRGGALLPAPALSPEVFGFEESLSLVAGADSLASAGARAQALLADVPQLDACDALMHAGGDLRLLERTLASFLRHLQSLTALSAEDVARMDWSERRRRAHTLRGLAGTVGARRMERLAARLESSAAQERALAWRADSLALVLLIEETRACLGKALGDSALQGQQPLASPADIVGRARVQAVIAERTGDSQFSEDLAMAHPRSPLRSRIQVRDLSLVSPAMKHVLSLDGLSLEESPGAPADHELSAEFGLRAARALRALAAEYDGQLLGLWPQLSGSLLSWLPGDAAAELDTAMTQCQFSRAAMLLEQLEGALAQVCEERAQAAELGDSELTAAS